MGLRGSNRATKVGYDYSPSYYTPSPVGLEASNKVSAHLKGIDIALGARYSEGLLTNRPAYGNDGFWYRCTDTEQLFVDNGSQWVEVCAIGTGAPVIYERHVATANQTVFTLSSHYNKDEDALQVYRNGNRQTVNQEYTETSTLVVTFANGLDVGDEVIFIQFSGGSKNVVTARQDFTATGGQTAFDLNFTYRTGYNDILVYSSGVLQRVGASYDYVETDADTITFNSGRALNEQIAVLRVGANDAGTVALYEKHVATQGQTVFDLAGAYVSGTHVLLVFKNGQLLTITDDYAETNNQRVTLTAGADAGDVLIFRVPFGDTEAGVTGTAANISTNTSNFDHLLSAADNTVQKALETLDDHGHYSEGLLTNRPASSLSGLWYRTTDTQHLFVDNGTSWIEVCCVGTGAPTIYERHVATAGQTVFDLSSVYDIGKNALQVYRNGNRQTIGASNDYQETDSDTVTFNAGLGAGDEVVFMQFSGGAKNVITARQDFTSTAGQTVYNLNFTYRPGYDDILVYSGGILQTVGGGNDYVETDSDTITFNSGRALNERVTVLTVGANDAGVVGLYEKHTATGGQTVFNLSGTYIVGTHCLLVFKNGVLLEVGDDYTETNSTTVTLAVGANLNDKLIFRVMNGDTELTAHDLSYHSDVTNDGADAFVAAQDEGADAANRFALLSDFGAEGSFFGSFFGLEIFSNQTNPTYQVDIKKGLICINDDLDGTIKTTSNLTVDITASGANGLDTGSEASSTWYYIWVIKNPTSGAVAGLFSTSATSPTMPSGYTKKRLIGTVYNDSGSNLYEFRQDGDRVNYQRWWLVLGAGSATGVTAVDMSNFVPSMATETELGCEEINSSSVTAYIRTKSAGTEIVRLVGSAAYLIFLSVRFPIFVATNFYYYQTGAGGALNVYIRSFRLRL